MRKRLTYFKTYFSIENTAHGTTVASHLLHEVKKYSQMMLAASKPKVVLMNSGHWALRHLDPASYISDMTEVFNILRTLIKPPNNLRIIWIQSSAMSYKTKYIFRWKVNNIIAAMNDWVDWNMEKIGVPVLKSYDISVPMNSKTYDGIHYRELLRKDVTSHKHHVSVGGAIDSVLFNLIFNNVNCS